MERPVRHYLPASFLVSMGIANLAVAAIGRQWPPIFLALLDPEVTRIAGTLLTVAGLLLLVPHHHPQRRPAKSGLGSAGRREMGSAEAQCQTKGETA